MPGVHQMWTHLLTFLKSNALRIIFAVGAAVVLYFVGRSLLAVLFGGFVGAILGGGGHRTESPRRSASGTISNPPNSGDSGTPPNSGTGNSDSPPNQPTSPRRRRR